MDSAILIDFENHRSRERIKDLGEVFTPEKFVQHMLSILDAKVWNDESVIFFEPTCGHGNFVVPIFLKRVAALRSKYEKSEKENHLMFAIANAVNSLWAADICSKNIELTKKRIFEQIALLLQKEKINFYQRNTKNFVSHILCALNWQIQENEVLSSLGTVEDGSKTRFGVEWLKANKHKPIDFENPWTTSYQKNKSGIAGERLERATNFLEACIQSKSVKGFSEFNYATEILQNLTPVKRSQKGIEIEVA